MIYDLQRHLSGCQVRLKTQRYCTLNYRKIKSLPWGYSFSGDYPEIIAATGGTTERLRGPRVRREAAGTKQEDTNRRKTERERDAIEGTSEEGSGGRTKGKRIEEG